VLCGGGPAAASPLLDDELERTRRHHLMHTVVHMRTTINLDEQLIEEAQRITGTQERTALIHDGLRALIARESAKRLARLGGSDPRLVRPRRRRSS
jgi:Arc/MetJ family transcription regulator